MKLAVFSDLFPPLFIGGYEVGASLIVAELRRRGHEVLVFSSHSYRQECESGYRRRAHEDPAAAGVVDVGPCLFGKLSIAFRRTPLRTAYELARLPFVRRRYRAALAAFRPDVMLMFNPLGVMAPVVDDFIAYSKNTGAPVASYVSDSWLAHWPAANPLWYFVQRLYQARRRLVRHAGRVVGRTLKALGLLPTTQPLIDRYLYCSKFIQGLSRNKSIGVARHAVVHWGVTAAASRVPRPADRFTRGGPLTLVFAGQLLEHKGLAVVLRALRRCARPHPLLVVGDDTTDYAVACKALAGKLGLGEQVRFLGKKQNSEMLELLSREGGALVVPSLWDEPFSIVVLEGMAVGLPVIASDTGGTAEAVRDGETGFLFERGDYRQLAEVIDQLEGDRALCRRVGERARQMVLSDLTLEGMVDQILHELNGVNGKPALRKAG